MGLDSCQLGMVWMGLEGLSGGGFEPKSISVLWMPVDCVLMAGLFSMMVNAS